MFICLKRVLALVLQVFVLGKRKRKKKIILVVGKINKFTCLKVINLIFIYNLNIKHNIYADINKKKKILHTLRLA